MNIQRAQDHSASRPKRRDIYRIILIYALVSATWIVLSDTIVHMVFADLETAAAASIVKGFLFIGITSLVLYGLLLEYRQKLLKAAAEKNRTLLLLEAVSEHSPDAIFAKDTKGRYTFVNRAASAMIGMPPREALDHRDADVFALREAAAITAADSKILRDGVTLTEEELLTTAQGARILHAKKGPLRDDAGHIVGLYGIARDITESATATASLRQSYADLAATLRAIPDLLFDIDKDGTYHEVWAINPKLLVQQREIAIGKRVADVLPKDAADIVMQAINDADISGSSYGKVIHIPISHKVLWFELSVAKKAVSDGAIQHFIVLSRDITQRKIYEEQVAADERRLRLLLEHAPAALAIFDTSMKYIAVSRRWMTDYDLGDQDVVGRSHYDVFPDVSEAWRTLHQRGLAGETLRADADACVGADGVTQWLRWQIQPWAHTNGAVGGILIFSEDITDVKAKEEAARLSENKLHAALESMNEAVFIIDADGVLVEFNSAFARFLKFASKAEVPATLERFVDTFEVSGLTGERLPPDQWFAYRALHGECGENVEIILHRKGTGQTWIGSHNFAPIYGDNGRITGAVVTARDVTEEKHQAQALLRASEKNKALLRNASDGVHVLDEKGNLIDASDSFLEMLGYTREDLLGQHVAAWDAMFSADEILENLRRQLNSTERKQFETRHKRKDGSTFDVEVSGVTVVMDGVKVLFNSSRDITDRKLNERRIAAYITQIENMMRGTLNVVAHAVEIRDPYTAGHERRVGIVAADIAREMGWSEERCANLNMIGLVHDIGKIGVPAEILSKPSRLSTVEYELVKGHVEAGYEILKFGDFSEPIAEIVRAHHERMDGSGYPRGLKGDEIPPEARIISVADVLESMSSHRPYRPALGMEAAIKEIEDHAGTWFDSSVVHATLRLIREKGYQMPL